MKFSRFAKTLEEIETTSSRNDMIELVLELLKSLDKEEVGEALYLMQGRVVPKFVSLEFNVARKLMMRAIAKAASTEVSNIEEEFKELGDLGLVVEKELKGDDSKLSIIDVYQRLYRIASAEGRNSQQDKIDKIADLFNSCDQLSARYVTRMVLGNLRLGLSEKSILDALSIYSVGDKSERKKLDRAYGVRNDIALIAEEVMKNGIEKIESISIIPGVPVASMLCEREPALGKILDRIEKPFVQPKYDGLRAQIHLDQKGLRPEKAVEDQHEFFKNSKGIKVEIFSRNLESLTHMFPDVAQAVESLSIQSAIFDGEIIAYDENTDEFLPFQETIQRRRKYDVKEKSKEVPVRLYVYDLLFLDGEDLISKPYEIRVQRLEKTVEDAKQKGVIFQTPTDQVKEKERLEAIFQEYVDEGLEGIIVKDPKSLYMPGKRGYDWIKYKKSSKGFVVDTVDAVVLGYYKGRGARAKFGIGAFLIGVLNKKKGSYQSIAKVGTGIKDEEWEEIKNTLDEIDLDAKPSNVEVSKQLFPDIWVEPKIVVEVEADEITKSPNHTAGFDEDEGMGYSLRFPRLKLFNRVDKTPDRATTVEEIKKWHKWAGRKK